MTDEINDGAQALLRTVVDGGYCVGCGACATLRPDRLKIVEDDFGQLQARAVTPLPQAPAAGPDPREVCPFSGKSADEDQIATEAFPEAGSYTDGIGKWDALSAGYVVESDFRLVGTSGGMTNWLAAELLQQDYIDAIIHIKPSPHAASGLLFEYSVSHTLEELKDGAKTRYYPCEISSVMEFVRANPARYAIVSLPCFSRAMRLLKAQDPLLAECITFQISLVCGHLKSTAYARYYGWSSGIEPDRLEYIDFRFKSDQAESAKNYFVKSKERGTGREEVIRNSSVFGTDWGLGFFKLKACDFCDDVLGETADATVGDAWLPQYHADPAGTNIVITRSPIMTKLVADAAGEGRLFVEKLNAGEVLKSQEAGLRHRRAGLAYRLFLRDVAGSWRPPKRVEAGWKHLPLVDRILFRLRESLRDRSHVEFLRATEQGDYGMFTKSMRPIAFWYDLVQLRRKKQWWKASKKKLRSVFPSFAAKDR